MTIGVQSVILILLPVLQVQNPETAIILHLIVAILHQVIHHIATVFRPIQLTPHLLTVLHLTITAHQPITAHTVCRPTLHQVTTAAAQYIHLQ